MADARVSSSRSEVLQITGLQPRRSRLVSVDGIGFVLSELEYPQAASTEAKRR